MKRSGESIHFCFGSAESRRSYSEPYTASYDTCAYADSYSESDTSAHRLRQSNLELRGTTAPISDRGRRAGEAYGREALAEARGRARRMDGKR